MDIHTKISPDNIYINSEIFHVTEIGVNSRIVLHLIHETKVPSKLNKYHTYFQPEGCQVIQVEVLKVDIC